MIFDKQYPNTYIIVTDEECMRKKVEKNYNLIIRTLIFLCQGKESTCIN